MAEAEAPRYSNSDLEPTHPSQRTWNFWHIAALWVGMSICITTYQLAASLIKSGMNWWQAILTVALGNIIVLIPLALNAFPGTKYGIPFPVLIRSSFGIVGSNIPALMRAIVACGWFGIQTWIGGKTIYLLAATTFGWPAEPAPDTHLPILGISGLEFTCFLIFWAINLGIIWIGMNSIKWLEVLSAPFLIAVGIALLLWAWNAAGGVGPMLEDAPQEPGQFWKAFAPGLTGMVAYWATLSLNIPDFSRFAKSQKDQILGQALGLPTTMTLFAFIGVAVTSATIVLYKEPIWDPVILIGRIGNPVAIWFAMLAISIATLTTNLAANVVSPANDFSNLAPRLISFRMGATITAIVGILMMPWKLMADPSGYIFTWLIGYSALLGPIGGIMIADYFICRKQTLHVDSLYHPTGIYPKFFPPGIIALAIGILPNLPGFLMQVLPAQTQGWPPFLKTMYDFAWFIGFFVAFAAYIILFVVYVVLYVLLPKSDNAISSASILDSDESCRAETHLPE